MRKKINYTLALKSIFYKLRNNPFFIKEYIKKIYYYLTYDFNKISKLYSQFTYLGVDKTLNQIIDKKKSIVRFGDGEIEMIKGGSNYSGRYSEKYSRELSEKLTNCLTDVKNENILICVPFYHLLKNYKKSFFWQYAQYNYYNFLDKNYVYGDAFVFRHFQKKHIEKFFNYIKNKDILYISNFSNIFDMKKYDILSKINYLEVPYDESFSNYSEIKSFSLDFIKKKKNPIIIISSGKTSKVLAYDLANRVQVIDMGAFFEVLKYREEVDSSYK